MERELDRTISLLYSGGGECHPIEGVFWSRLRLLVVDSVASAVLPELGSDAKVIRRPTGYYYYFYYRILRY